MDARLGGLRVSSPPAGEEGLYRVRRYGPSSRPGPSYGAGPFKIACLESAEFVWLVPNPPRIQQTYQNRSYTCTLKARDPRRGPVSPDWHNHLTSRVDVGRIAPFLERVRPCKGSIISDRAFTLSAVNLRSDPNKATASLPSRERENASGQWCPGRGCYADLKTRSRSVRDASCSSCGRSLCSLV